MKPVQVVIGQSFCEGLEPLERAVREGYEPVLLFPSEGAVALDASDGVSWRERTSGRRSDDHRGDDEIGKVLLVLLDGTWTQVRQQASNLRSASSGIWAAF